MDDNSTNLNNSGFGTKSNWTDPSQGPPAANQKGSGGVSGPFSGADLGLSTGFSTSLEDQQWQDVISQAFQTDAKTTTDSAKSPYVTYSNQPNLTQPTVNDPTIAHQGLNLLTNPPASVQQDILNNLDSSLQNPLGGDSEAYANDTVTDPQINALAQTSGVAAGIIQHNVANDQNQNFASLIANLPQADQDKLTFAYYDPSGAANLSPDLKNQLASLIKQATTLTADNFKFTSDWQALPVDASVFNMKLGVENELSFENLLQSKVNDGSLSQADANTLRAMHNGLATGTPTLKNLLKQLEGQTITMMQAKWGFDTSYSPPVDPSQYQNILNGNFSISYQKAIANYTGDATPEQQALLAKYAANPNDPSIPDDIKQLAKQIAADKQLLLQNYPDLSALPANLQAVAKQLIQQTNAAIVAQYGVDPTWTSTLTTLAPPAGVNSASQQQALGAIGTAQELINQATAKANGMAAGPEKTSYLNFLQVIGEALSKLQESVYAMQASQSDASKEMNRAKLDMGLNDIDKQQRAADKAKASTAKMASMGPFAKIFEWIIRIILLILCCCLGPIGALIGMAYFASVAVSQAMGQKADPVKELMQTISKNLPPAAAALINTLVCCATLSPWLSLYLFLGDANVIQDVVKACGGSEMAQQMVAMVVQIVVMLAIMIVLLLVTGGAATEAMAAKFAEMIERAIQVSSEVAERIVKISRLTVATVIASLTISSEGVKMNNNILLSQMDIIKGEADAYSEVIQGIIALLKKVIAKLLELLQNGSDMIVSISNFQGKKWSDASQVMSDLVA